MKTLDGKRAGVLVIICKLCKGDTFKLLLKAPPDARVGDVMPPGTYNLQCAECVACGEQYPIVQKGL